jgi:dihydroorotate dehydrogenase (NAD+) catalytic subunit
MSAALPSRILRSGVTRVPIKIFVCMKKYITQEAFMSELPVWWPEKPPIYDIEKSYLENLNEGPFFDGKIPHRALPAENSWIDFLGFRVASPIGVPAGPLLNGRWTLFAAEMGFDIVTYKTIRSKAHPAHSLPNMIYVDTKGMLSYSRAQELLFQAKQPPEDMFSLAATNSFGIPSQNPEWLIEDIAAANASLAPGQVMIVSVVGTPREGEDFVEDFAYASKVAMKGGAKIIEADLSCPNVVSCEGSLFTSPEMVFDISQKIKKTIGAIPLIIKVGVIENANLLRHVMIAAAKAGVQAICGINTMSMKVVKDSGQPALGSEKRLKAGVCGGPIRELAVDFIHKARKINNEEKLGMVIMGTGGVTSPEHFDLFFKEGADIAMSAVGMLWDPYLAARYHRRERKAWIRK